MKSKALLISILLLFFCACGNNEAVITPRDFKSIDIVGDSISFGENPQQGRRAGWVQMLYGQLANSGTIKDLWPDIKMNNSSIGGSTAFQWAKDNYQGMTTLKSNKPDLVIVLIGGNDFLFALKDGKFSMLEKTVYKKCLNSIIDNLQALDPKPEIIVVGYYDLFDGMSGKLPDTLQSYRNASPGVLEGNKIIRSIAEKKGCHYVDLYDAFMDHSYSKELGNSNYQLPSYFRLPLNRFDYHPITAGHQAIYKKVYEKLKEFK